jgi:Xaa-Pro aminopeptidase
MNSAFVLVDSKGPEILHRTGITAPDSFIYIYPEGGVPTVFFDAREYDVQLQKIQQLQNGVQVERIEPYVKNTFVETLLAVLRHYEITEAKISPNMPYVFAKAISDAGIVATMHDYEAERDQKTTKEVQYMIEAQRVNESAFSLAQGILEQSVITGKQIMYQGDVLTSEFLKSKIRIHLLEQGYDCPDGIIVASGAQTARPHDEGSGELLPHQAIIIDIFPRSEKTGFFADMTRTFVKGQPSNELRKLFEDVIAVQKTIAETIQVGEICSDVHARTIEEFKKLGHPTSPEKGFMTVLGIVLGYQCMKVRASTLFARKQYSQGWHLQLNQDYIIRNLAVFVLRM